MNIGIGISLANYRPVPTVPLDPDAAIAALFESGEVGAWYDPSDSTTVFQDAAGTTPATVGDPVGLILDKSQGLTLGAEQVANGDFSLGSSNWAVGAQTTIASGQADVVNAAHGTNILQQNTVQPGANVTVRISLQVSGWTSGNLFCYINNNTALLSISGDGTYTAHITSTLSTGAGFLIRSSGTFTGTIDNISVRELPGNHATQTTSAARPVLQIANGTPSSFGPELVTNGTFDTDLSGWTTGSGTATWLSASNIELVGAVGVTGRIYQAKTFSTGKTYKISVNVLQASAPSPARVEIIGGASLSINSPGSYSLYFVGTGSNQYVQLRTDNTGASAIVRFADISVQEVTAWTGGQYYLDFDGVDDALTTAAVDLSGTSQLAVAAGVRDVAMTGSRGTVFNTNLGNYNGASLFVPSATLNNIQFSAFGDPGGGSMSIIESGLPNSLTAVLLANTDLSTTSNVLRRDGAVVATHGIAGAGNYTNTPLYFGHRGGSSFFNGNLCACVVIDRTLSAGEITDLETYLAAKSGVTL